MTKKSIDTSLSEKRNVRELERRRVNREAILHAAEAVICRKGLGATSMDDVAAEAGFSKATLYKYVRGKSELVFELMIHFVEDLNERLLTVLDKPIGPEAKLLVYLRENITYQAEKENIARAFVSEPSYSRVFHAMVEGKDHPSSAIEGEFFRRLVSARDVLAGRLERFVQESVAAGAFRPAPRESAVHFISMVILGYQHERFFRESKPDLEKDVLNIHGFILRGLKAEKQANA